ncbi:MAG: hypothetical protein GW772_11770 [Flavobacteriia bacterium]|nr:hypothetical protein [Flavobacteriia bacterium]OIP47701.1 MAG: hypothetical protein AUK46_04140 [Flavobacteriaceae bacterium CG2_30_31_66]PIV97391.1 MAG: hypothetical protein COW43_03110 [Flavobacteriaceae bacterium CG17_big_fil_post_rev_8_21_14_2_50_31_13]PIX13251.1 MAG: hypothetical protein COZ74_07225 [Flavobacteriaceae bacterium CG_4_8_14_3_um_filter_31_8]PIY14749.1 MAG: hypothetical protein COZ16_07350 [Flavobacteriaceae bacterium CG_4_10_14_3_um_filter_31_253]PIZ12098.1 MAG: hypotheti
MSKLFFIYFLLFFALYFLGFNLHQFILQKYALNTSFSLQKVYLFHFGFSLLICINFNYFSSVDKIFQQLGFIYLITIFLKIILFSAIFYKSVFNEENLPFFSRVSLFIPAIIFLLTEAIFITKILNKKQ